VRLRALEPKHYDLLYQWVVSGVIPWQWYGRPPSPEAFRETLWSGVLCQYLFERASDGLLIGLGTAYGVSHHHQHCYFRAGIVPEVRRHGWPLEGGIAFVDHLFQTYNLRKVYAEATDATMPTFAAGNRFSVEAHFRDHLYRGDGEFQDMYVLSATREGWDECRASVRNFARSLNKNGLMSTVQESTT
jgi:RimJ/RimL family protein N-acetyltransferase